jgi:hypothetical protein
LVHEEGSSNGRKRFFFEKKKQKTFTHCGQLTVQIGQVLAALIDKSFLVLFFKKEVLAFRC